LEADKTMNVTHIFLSNGQWNWDAIGTISSVISVILAAAMVWIKWRSLKKVKNQPEQMKIDRLVKEMDKLVAPLYSKIGDKIIFQKGAPGYIDSTRPRDQGYFRFWDEIKQTKYLGSDYLRSAIDNYLRNKSNKVDDRTRDAPYEKAETELFEAIKRRYSELENGISRLRKKS
jgi:hypothetical protein